ncbi:uncharacterized protein LOC108114014 [Drosophila eugracilis]|uniref:uncharacterized protein LOC108114014 n=1 Tax=Drosophila eugracilis TaxID=29029 RepID=UPI0007E706A1|nr:uncharacterized protein LOC108114014 [Drosophila eugracilis]
MGCYVPELPQFGSGTEVTHCSISALDDIPLHEEGSSDLELSKAFDRLEKMKQRALYLKGRLIRPLTEKGSECSTESNQIPMDTKSDNNTKSGNAELRVVQEDTARAYQQISYITSQLKETKGSLSILDRKVRSNIRCTKQLQKRLSEVPKWQEELRHHTGLCIERFNDLDICKGNYLEYSDNFVRPSQNNMKCSFNSKVPNVCYKQDYCDFNNLLNRTRKLMLKCCEQLKDYTEVLDKVVNSQKDKAPLLPSISEISLLLEQNSQVTKPRRSSVKMRRSFKFAWAAPMPKQPKHWLHIDRSERDY